MFSPTDVVVTVKQARNLVIKAKSGINDAYATIEFLKEKYVTGTEKSLTPRWYTECSFALPQGGIFASKVLVVICVYHKRHGKLGLEPDEFLGQVQIPLSELNTCSSKEQTQWYSLSGRKNNGKKERGEIEVSLRFLRQTKDDSLPNKPSTPKSIKALTHGLRHKLRRRSEDEDSGLGVSDSDRGNSLGRTKVGRSYENLAALSVIDSHNTAFERNFRTSSTNSSPGTLHSARGSARLLQPNNHLDGSKAMSVEVLHQSDNSLQRSNSSGSDKPMKSFIKQHNRNRSMPDSRLAAMMGQLRKDDDATSSTLSINGSQFYLPGPQKSGSDGGLSAPEIKLRSSSMEKLPNSSQKSPLNKNSSNSLRRHSLLDLDNIKKQAKVLSAVYKPKNYYRLDVKELCKVSPIMEDSSSNAVSYERMTHDELVRIAYDQKSVISKKDKQIRELEDYIDSLLVKVMAFTPQILDDSISVCSPKDFTEF